MTKLKLFECKKLHAKLSIIACAANRQKAQKRAKGEEVNMGPCVNCTDWQHAVFVNAPKVPEKSEKPNLPKQTYPPQVEKVTAPFFATVKEEKNVGKNVSIQTQDWAQKEAQGIANEGPKVKEKFFGFAQELPHVDEIPKPDMANCRCKMQTEEIPLETIKQWENVPSVCDVLDEYEKARTKHPHFADNAHHALVVMTEELGEVGRALLDGDLSHAKYEATQLAAVCLRFCEEIETL